MTPDGNAYSGIMDSVQLFPPEVPSFWQVYITVDDVRATVTRGGTRRKILMGGEDTPYGTRDGHRSVRRGLRTSAHRPRNA